MSSDSDATDDRDVTQRLQRALLDAFPKRSALEQMLNFGLNVRLNEIAAESLNLAETVFEVIKHFDRRGHLRDLIEAAREHNPDSPALRELVKSLPPPSAAVVVRRKAHHHPGYALAALVVIAVGLGILTIVGTQASLTERQLMAVKAVLGLLSALFIGVMPRRWRLRIGDALVYGSAGAALLLAFFTPATAGLMSVNGRVFYEGTLEPVKDVVVSVRGTTTQRSPPTADDGSFVLESVPSTATELYFKWGGSEDKKAAIETPTGGEYKVIPKPVRFVPTAPIEIPSAAWTPLKRSECPPPSAAFGLDTTIPAHHAGAAAYVDIRLRDGVRFVRAVTLHNTGRGYTLSVDRAIQRRWIFTETSVPVRPEIEVCLGAALSVTPMAADMTVRYWYEERK